MISPDSISRMAAEAVESCNSRRPCRRTQDDGGLGQHLGLACGPGHHRGLHQVRLVQADGVRGSIR